MLIKFSKISRILRPKALCERGPLLRHVIFFIKPLTNSSSWSEVIDWKKACFPLLRHTCSKTALRQMIAERKRHKGSRRVPPADVVEDAEAAEKPLFAEAPSSSSSSEGGKPSF